MSHTCIVAIDQRPIHLREIASNSVVLIPEDVRSDLNTNGDFAFVQVEIHKHLEGSAGNTI